MFFFIIKNNRKFIYSAFIFLIVFSNGLVSEALWRLLEYPWKRLDYSSVEYSDGIVVLSSRRHLPPGNTKIIEWYDPDRFFAGIDLYKANKANRLIFTGGINPLVLDLYGACGSSHVVSFKSRVFAIGPIEFTSPVQPCIAIITFFGTFEVEKDLQTI